MNFNSMDGEDLEEQAERFHAIDEDWQTEEHPGVLGTSYNTHGP
jgi:hypothetical protein